MPFSINSTTYRTPNRQPGKRGAVYGIMIHSDEGTFTSSVAGWPGDPGWLLNPTSGVSCDYYVCRDGRIFQFADNRDRTWHGGAGSWDGVDDLNLFIGIECEHKQGQDWPQVQRDALAWLCRQLIAEHDLPQQRIIAHRWAAPRRKKDPTNWPDKELRTFIAALYEQPSGAAGRQAEPTPPGVRRFVVGPRGAIIRTGKNQRYDVVAELAAGEVIAIQARVFDEALPDRDWWHTADGRGFIEASALRAA